MDSRGVIGHTYRALMQAPPQELWIEASREFSVLVDEGGRIELAINRLRDALRSAGVREVER